MKAIGKTLVLAGVLALTWGLSGCGQTSAPSSQQTAPKTAHADHADHKEGDKHSSASKATAKDDHSGWWCNEHGVPEGECGQCNAKLAAEFQKKGDWCKEHDRPDSQCFVCHPEKEAVFAARYEAKYGTKPPKPEVN